MSEMKKIIVEYIWIGGNDELRSKTKVLPVTEDEYNDYLNIILPQWDYDGSSCNQATGNNSEVIIKPQKICKCPFRRNGNNLIVLCDTYDSKGEPLSTNTRYNASKIFEQKIEEEVWWGLEQEFYFMDAKTDMPTCFNSETSQLPKKLGQYYCAIGAKNVFCRHIMEEAFDNMMYAGLTISGINNEVGPMQHEYQIGITKGIDGADQLWLSRYILERSAEKYNIYIEYHPKPLGHNWPGTGMHHNISTKKMREEGGLDEIMKAIKKLEAKHMEHMVVYGKYNEMRMTGLHETASFEKFTYGRADRGASVRIGNDVYDAGCGYFEDRRISGNVDPYLSTSKIFETICL